ncbi:MAG: DUF6602 domain-containing protein [Pseudomonadota bacterium]
MTKGVIRDFDGRVGPSVDVILLNPCHPYTAHDDDDKLSLILAEGVEAAIEVKSDPLNKAEFETAFKQSAKNMEVKRPVVSFNSEAKIESVPYFIYFLKEVESHEHAENIINELLENYSIDQCPDYIVLHNCGIFKKIEKSIEALGNKKYVFLSWKKMTIGGLIYYINHRPAVPVMYESIMKKYMRSFSKSVIFQAGFAEQLTPEQHQAMKTLSEALSIVES